MEINFIGEHPWLQHAGKLAIVLAFTSAFLSAIAYFISTFRKNDAEAWRTFARASFAIHGISIFAIFGLMYYIIYNHYFEFHYAWFHSSTTMPARYIFACFWEGQEGSFLLWSFWHVIISIFIIFKNKAWESPVMSVIMMVQVFLGSMVLGLWIGDIHLGSNPFILLREHPDMANLPFIQLPEYLSKIKDGRGLNPLLQNYWMVIHPPTLFLGFASTVVPFAFAIAGLLTGKVKEWIQPALSYTFFSVMILGTGILMGAAWAYEALSFGGFWAWDPVENASLVPWITLVATAHLMLIVRKTGNALLTTFILAIVTFLLILYSTFLTRSGILGDSSVHAFTDLGMQGQLVIYMAFFTILSIILLIINRKKIPLSSEEESLTSREFWIFIGALVLIISSIQIIATTSIPVFNKLFDLKKAPPADLIDHYNKWQIPIASIICILIAIGQYFKYKQTDIKQFYKKIGISLLISIIATIAYQLYLELPRPQHVVFLFASLFAFLANMDYFIRVLKGKIAHSGASIAHAGIALIMLGALISNVKKTVISQNRLGIDLGKELPASENILLRKGDTLQMGNYFVTYKGREKEGINVKYEVEYYKLNKENGKLDKQFSLWPFIQLNERMGNAAEPDTKHYLDKDIYTHIQYANLDDLKNDDSDEFQEPKKHELAVGDTIATSNSLVILKEIKADFDSTNKNNSIQVFANLDVIDVNKKLYQVSPSYNIKDNIAFSKDTVLDELGTNFAFVKIDTEHNKITIEISEKKSNAREFIVMKAIIFPQINILWTGCLLMIIGTLIALRKRFKENKRLSERPLS